MIPFVDVEVTAKFKALFPDVNVRWVPSDIASQMAAAGWGPLTSEQQFAQDALPDQLAPFVGVYRTSIEDDVTQMNASMERRGFTTGRFYQDTHTPFKDKAFVSAQRRKAALVSYEVSVWTRQELQRIDMARTISFADQYLPVLPHWKLEEYRFMLEPSTPTYTYGNFDKTGRILWYSAIFPYQVRTFWVEEDLLRTILTIQADFYAELISGGVVTQQLLDSIIIPTPEP